MRVYLISVVILMAASVVQAAWNPADGDSWEFIQSVGGISVGDPLRNEKDDIVLPVQCDVTGLTKITIQPTSLNSARTVQFVLSGVYEDEIWISVRSGLARNRQDPYCREVNLRNLETGMYRVYYYGSDEAKHLLRTVKVPW